MGLSPRLVVRLLSAALLLLAGAAAVDLWRLAEMRRTNAAIDAGGIGADDAAAPELRFAQAHAQAARGATEAALSRYGALQDDSPLGRAARYNGANLLLRQAIELHAGAHPGQALALVELAKENYRANLRIDPHDWSARYNLERAQRLVPEPEERDEPQAEAKRDAERAPTTMRGVAPGLP